MGKLDAEEKQYVSNRKIFADAFNYLIYGGKQVIKADALQAVDTTEIAIPYGNGAREPVQKYRDLLKIWGAMQDGKCVYVLLGAELQSKVHYAMPVRDMLYDALNYTSQVDEARSSYRKKGAITTEGDSVTIKLSQEEFLSGFRKEDKLIPVVTAVIYFGPDTWDGPKSIHEMLDCDDKAILKVVPDYKINLIAPAETPDGDFDTKFSTGLGLVLHALKYSQTKAMDVLLETNHKRFDRESGEFIGKALGIDLKFSEPKEEGEVDVSKAAQEFALRERIKGAIDMLRDDGLSDSEIIKRVTKKYDVTEEYVLDLMHTAA